MMQAVANLGAAVIDSIVKLGYAARLFALLMAQSGTSFRRLRLTIAQTHFIGNYSLVIIVVSGLFVASNCWRKDYPAFKVVILRAINRYRWRW